MGPGGPLRLNPPGGPAGPLCPGAPAAPAGPGDPAYPGAPVAPVAPGAPGGPGGPETIHHCQLGGSVAWWLGRWIERSPVRLLAFPLPGSLGQLSLLSFRDR